MELDVEVMARLRSGTGQMSWLLVVNYMSGRGVAASADSLGIGCHGPVGGGYGTG